MSAAAAGAAGAAAAAARRRMIEEEEEMTPYRAEDLKDNWEFKILRSTTGAFGNPEKLRLALEEEARAGWILVEKFDHGRIRLKRPANARQGDANLDFDPYRTYVGMSEGKFAVAIAASVLGACLALMAVLALVLR
jgi:hypothetical protein